MIRYPVSRPCIGPAERDLVDECLRQTRLSMGTSVATFESLLAQRLGVEHVVTTTSGTTALHLALVSLGIGPGDEVVVPDLTFVATANAVHYTGAKVVLADVDPNTWCIDPQELAAKVWRRTRAVVPVHLYGVPCEMNVFKALEGTGTFVIEDAAEGLGGSWEGHALGTIGDCGIFSFFGNKVLTTGEGGAVVTNDGALAARLRFLRGQALDPQRRYYHPEIGFNYRMTDLQAAVGCGQMTHLGDMLKRRREIITLYRQELAFHGFTPMELAHEQHAPWLFTLQLPPNVQRDNVMARLLLAGIETRPVFVPMHRLPMFKQDDWRFPVASEIGDAAMSLPTYPELTNNDVQVICYEFVKACDGETK